MRKRKFLAGVLAAAMVMGSLTLPENISFDGIDFGTTSVQAADTYDIPDEAVSYNGHYYMIYEDSVTWTEAETLCEEMGGHLATITSDEENSFIENFISSGTKYFYWLGATDEVDEGVWLWVTGETWDYSNWITSDGQPDNSEYDGETENYLSIISSRKGWNDLCNGGDTSGNCVLSNGGFVCEWGVDGYNVLSNGAIEFNGHYYYLYEKGYTWEEAEAYCEERGGHLITVTTQEEQDLVEYMLSFAQRNSYWMGGHMDEDGSWYWLTGEDFSYENWASGQPDNYTSSSEAALMVYCNDNPNAGGDGLGTWNDLNSDGSCNDEDFFGQRNFGFICEWESDDVDWSTLDITATEYEFTYSSGDTDYTATCYYTDEYFTDSAYTYNASLATMSISLAMSAFASCDGTTYETQSKNVVTLLSDIGFTDIDVNDWFMVKPTKDSIGVAVGSKTLNTGETLIAVAVRGGNYESEWASNFTIGTETEHDGFEEAKDNVIEYLKEYIEQNEISGDIVLWITGYSRASATANLVAGALDNETSLGDDVNLDPNNLFAYCFEVPRGALISDDAKNDKYSNIFNIINTNDIVPQVAPYALGFTRYGVDCYLPSSESSSGYDGMQEQMLEIYNSLDSTDGYEVDDFQMKKVMLRYLLPGGNSVVQDDTENNYSQGTYLSNFITILSKEVIVSRENYVENYQDDIREILGLIFGWDSVTTEKVLVNFGEELSDNYIKWIAYAVLGDVTEVAKVFYDCLDESIQSSGVTDYDIASLTSAAAKMAGLVIKISASHPNYTVTLISNLTGIGQAHYPELCFSWLASMDENYTDTPSAVYMNNGLYRAVHINCSVDVNVYDSTGTLVASIISDEPQDIDGSTISASYTSDGEKVIILPTDETYTVEIIATEDDTVNYCVSEYSAYVQDYTRLVNFFDIEMEEGETLVGIIPAYDEADSLLENGSSEDYTLTTEDDVVLEPDSDLTGDSATSAYYTVTVTSDTDDCIAYVNSSIYQYGTYAQVEAVSADDYDFVGWYDVDGECVSTETEYRFCVTEDVSLEACFVSIGTDDTGEDEEASEDEDTGEDEEASEDEDTGEEGDTNENVDADQDVDTGDDVIATPEVEITLGDINEDGFIDYLDAMTALRYDAELVTLDDNQLLAGDVNGDGSVDSLDAILILRYDAGLIEGF